MVVAPRGRRRRSRLRGTWRRSCGFRKEISEIRQKILSDFRNRFDRKIGSWSFLLPCDPPIEVDGPVPPGVEHDDALEDVTVSHKTYIKTVLCKIYVLIDVLTAKLYSTDNIFDMCNVGIAS